jgi:uncharacterized protein YaaR (DUF327 family)
MSIEVIGMEVSRVSNEGQVKSKSGVSSKNMKHDFSEEFGSAAKRERDKQLGKLLDDIKKKGRQVVETRSVAAVHDYKSRIKEYLSLVLKDAYRVDRLRSAYSGNPTTLVAIISEELDKLAQTVLVQEKDTISVVNMVDRIEGLLVDTYE